jgi:hypothetical protein
VPFPKWLEFLHRIDSEHCKVQPASGLTFHLRHLRLQLELHRVSGGQFKKKLLKAQSRVFLMHILIDQASLPLKIRGKKITNILSCAAIHRKKITFSPTAQC